MPPQAGPLGQTDIPYDSGQFRDLVEWLYSKHKSQPGGELTDAQHYVDILQFSKTEQTAEKG